VQDNITAKRSKARFAYEIDESGGMPGGIACALNPEQFFRTNCQLDYTVVALNRPSTGPSPLESVDVETQASILPGDTVVIVQHPYGGPKQVAVGTNHVVQVSESRLFYLTDTLPGSSGAPVFNDEWRVVAMHRRGGDMPVPPRGDRRYVNEGVLLSAIKSDMGSAWPVP
jgi:endonuclease G